MVSAQAAASTSPRAASPPGYTAHTLFSNLESSHKLKCLQESGCHLCGSRCRTTRGSGGSRGARGVRALLPGTSGPAYKQVGRSGFKFATLGSGAVDQDGPAGLWVWRPRLYLGSLDTTSPLFRNTLSELAPNGAPESPLPLLPGSNAGKIAGGRGPVAPVLGKRVPRPSQALPTQAGIEPLALDGARLSVAEI